MKWEAFIAKYCIFITGHSKKIKNHIKGCNQWQGPCSQVTVNFWPPNQSYDIWLTKHKYSALAQGSLSPHQNVSLHLSVQLLWQHKVLWLISVTIPVKWVNNLCRFPVYIWIALAQTKPSWRSWLLHWSICCHLIALFMLSLMLQQLVVYMSLYMHA